MNRVKPDEGAWAPVLGNLGISGAGPELLWESPLDWGRRVYRSKDRVYKIVLLENHTTGDLRNRTLQEESDILRALVGIRGIPACLEYRLLPGAEVLVMGLVDALPWAAYRGKLAKACLTFPRLVGLLFRVSARGIAHGDVKPENLLIDASANPWLVDFDQAHHSTPFRSLLANFLGWPIRGVTIHGGAVQFVKDLIKSLLPRPMLRLAQRAKRRLGFGASARIPSLAPLPQGASTQLALLHRAWQMAAHSDANAPGQGVSYYSMTFQGFPLPGERPWEDRWRIFEEAVSWPKARVLELGCNLGLLSTFAKLKGAEAALGVDADADILEGNRLVQRAFKIDYPTVQCSFDDLRAWEDELAAFRPTIVTALSVLNWVAQRDRFMQFLGRFDRVLFEGHDPDVIECRRLEAVGFTRIELLARSERERPVILAYRSR